MATYNIKSADGSRSYKITLPDSQPGEKPPQQPYSGSILPFTKDEQGHTKFDPNAGLIGLAKRVVSYPADALRGNIDPKSDEGIARAVEVATVASPVSAATRGGLNFTGGTQRMSRPAATPTAAELKSTGGFGFDLAREMGVDYDAEAVRDLMASVRSTLFKRGPRRENAPTSYTILDELENPPPGGIADIAGLHAAREQLSHAAMDFTHPKEQLVASRIIRAIDGFITNPDPKNVVAGPAAAAGNVWSDAMANYAAGKRSDRLTGIEERAEGRAVATNSGLNLDNALRQRVDTVLQDPKRRAGFSQDEISLLETVRDGTATRNTLRWVGNTLGGGGGLGAGVVGGGSLALSGAGGPAAFVAGVGPPAVGLAAKMVANRLTGNALKKADVATRQRSPLFEGSPPQTVPTPVVGPATGRAAVTQALGQGMDNPQASPIDPRMEAILRALNAPQITPEAYEEYVRQKYAPQQGS